MGTKALSSDSTTPADQAVTGETLATALATMFQAHDRGDFGSAIELCEFIDTYQFPHLDEEAVAISARSFVGALRAKDRIEFAHLRGGDLDSRRLASADYSPVRTKLRTRASVIGADHRYADTKAEAWKRHKVGGDYWTPFMRSQLYELRAILRDPGYPNKPRAGRSGFGPEPVRYILAFELHDMKTPNHWSEGIQIMTPYFEKILTFHESNLTHHESN